MAVHRELGPGLRERVYTHALAHELSNRGLRVAREVGIRVEYDGIDLGFGYRADLVVEDVVVVEVKALDTLREIHAAQILTYLKFSGCPIGLLLNFNHPTMKRGIRRVVARGIEAALES